MARFKKTDRTSSSIKNDTVINKIIYFDKETIRNILQEYNKGTKQTIINASNNGSIKFDSAANLEANFKIVLPFAAKLKFLFTGRIATEYMSQFDKTVTVTSTEISDFEKIKSVFTEFSNVTISDIENSATFFRVAGNYTRILKVGVKDVDIKEFKNVMEGYEGYDHYKIDNETYIRFNSTSFLSNYKRNDLLNSKLKVYCIRIGSFPKSNFDFIEQINIMQNLTTNATNQTIGDIYPNFSEIKSESEAPGTGNKSTMDNLPSINLYDVVYASINQKGE